MIQVKEFIDTDITTAEKNANEFLSRLDDSQVISVQYSTGYKMRKEQAEQRSNILIVYRVNTHAD